MSQVPPSSGSPYSPNPYGQAPQGSNPYSGPSASSAPGTYPPAGQGGYGQPYAQQPSAYGVSTYSSAPAYGAPAGPGAGPAMQVRSTTGPKILLGIGLVMLVGAIIAFVASLVSIANVGGSLSEIMRNGTSTATLEAGNVYAIYSDGLVSCEVADPSGAPVSLSPASGSNATVNDISVVGAFTPQSSGDYTITCVSTSSKPVYLGLSMDTGGVVASGLGILGALLVGLPGLFITVGGFIWLGVRRSQNKQAQAAAGGYPGAQF